jgi:hypothetical protein
MTDLEQNAPAEEAKQRGGCLTSALVVFTLATAAITVINFTQAGSIARNLPGAPAWAETGVYLMGLLGLIGIVGLVGIWSWKKWGAYLYFATGAIVFVVNLALGVGISSLGGLVGLAIIGALVKPVWLNMD